MARGKWTPGTAEEWRISSGPMTWRATFPGAPDQIGNARHLMETLFAGTGREEDAGLIISELATNSVLYTRSGQPKGWFGVEVVLDALAYLAVTDLGGAGRLIGTPPTSAATCEDDLELGIGGRGLLMVAELAVSMGVHGSPETGHTIWADIDLTPPDSGSEPRKPLLLSA